MDERQELHPYVTFTVETVVIRNEKKVLTTG
jgi:hypothetical protein